MTSSSYGKKINITYKFNENKRETTVEKMTSLKEMKEKIESEIKFSLSKMKLVYNGNNILLNNEKYKIYDFFGDVKGITLKIEPQEFTEESYTAQFEKAFLGLLVLDSDGQEINTTINANNNGENIIDNVKDKKKKKYLKNLVLDKVYNPKVKERAKCNHDKQNEASYICTKCRLYWCKHCIKYELHKADLVELDFLDTYLNMKRTNFSKEVEDHVTNDTNYVHLEKIDFILNEKISVIEKQFNELIQLLTRIKESQMKLLIDLFYQQVDNKQFKSITQDVQFFKNKVRQINSTYNKDNLEENLNNNDVLEKFKELIKQNYTEFKYKYTNYFNIFSQYENFNTTFQSQMEAKYKQSNAILSQLANPEELSKLVKNDLTIKLDNVNNSKSVLKMKYYNTILQWDHIKQKVNRIQNFEDRSEFKINYQVYSGNIFLNYSNRLFIVTGVNFNLFYFFDPSLNEMFKLPSLSENHCRGGLVYIGKLNSIICVSGKFSSKCERYELKDFKFPEKEKEKEQGGKSNQNVSANNVSNISNMDNTNWTEFPSLIYQRHSASFFIHNNSNLFCFFGYNSSKGSLDIIEKINLEKTESQWEIVNYSNTKFLEMKLSSHGTIYANNDEIYIVGGCINERFSDKIFKYNFIRNAVYLTDFIIPGINEHEYFRFWEESLFQSLSSFGFMFSSDGSEDDYTFGMFDAREKLHLFNVRSFKYKVI